MQFHEQELLYLQAAFKRIDLLLRREVRRWVLADQDPNDDYRGLYVAQAEAVALLDLPIGVNWGQSIVLPSDEAAAFDEALTKVQQEVETVTGTLKKRAIIPRLQQLMADFELLDPVAKDIFLLCLAPAFATRYERIYGYLQDNVTRRRPTVRLVLQLLGKPGMQQYALAHHLGAEAPLFKHRMLTYVTEPPPANVYWINQTLQVDEGVVAWLRGEYQPPAELQGHLWLEEPQGSETDQLLAGETLQRIREAMDVRESQTSASSVESSNDLSRDSKKLWSSPLLVFWGIDQVAQVAAGRLVAAQVNRPLLTVDLVKVIGESCPAGQAIQLTLREARLTGAVALLTGWDLCLDDDKRVMPEVLNELCAHPGLVIMAGRNAWQAGGGERQRRLAVYEFAAPDFDRRGQLWTHFVSNVTGASKPTEPLQAEALAQLASQFVLTSGQIRAAVAAAADRAQQAGRTLTADDLLATARIASQTRLGALATKLEPRYGWSDLILPQDQVEMLHELVATVQGRAKVLDEWGLGKKLAASAGVTALFAGPPGTGKTMAAEVIARALGYDMYKIDLSMVVSKYIGETEKNLERIFSEASSSNAILFFDEADALFGKRAEVKDAHDRFANIEISYLLQRMERYDGVAILATNLRAHLDDAFTRRLQFIIAFPFPQRGERYRIWQALFPSGVPRVDDLDDEFKRLAERFELTGANIRNIIYSAANLAASNGQVVTKEQLRHGVKRELQKMGRTVSAGEF